MMEIRFIWKKVQLFAAILKLCTEYVHIAQYISVRYIRNGTNQY